MSRIDRRFLDLPMRGYPENFFHLFSWAGYAENFSLQIVRRLACQVLISEQNSS
jgi:hypothetical protein